jgi:CheY-like chemotaxis protein
MEILVVDDDSVQRGVISAMLTASGNDVVEAEPARPA